MSEREATPLVRLAELEIDPDRLEDYLALLREEITASLDTETGVLMLYALAVKGKPHHIRMVEVYADEVAYQAHLQTPHFLKYKTRTADMVLALNLIETEPVLLGAK